MKLFKFKLFFTYDKRLSKEDFLSAKITDSYVIIDKKY